MPRKSWLLIAAVLLSSAFAGAVCNTVTVADTLYDQNGVLLNGNITIVNTMTITGADGCVVPAYTSKKATVTAGVLSVGLVPNSGSTPSGTYYTAEYHVSSKYFSESWTVPASGPQTLAGVRALSPPLPTIMIAASQITPPSPCINGQAMVWTGLNWTCSAAGGISTLNTLTALVQTFATGTSGSDFNIVSSGSTHTFNFPTAANGVRGLLTSADWNTFSAKQPALMVNTLTTLGDLLFVNATPALARLAGNITTTKQFLTQTGNGSISASPAWLAIVAADIPAGTNCGANQFSNGILAALAPQCAQPSFSNLSGSIATGQLPAPISIPNSNTFEVFNGSNSQTFNIYGATSTDNTTNYARLRVFYDDSAQHRVVFNAEKGGTGSIPNGMDFVVPASANYRFSVAGAIGAIIASSGFTFYNGISTAGQGVEVIRGSLSAAAQTAALGTTNLYASAPAGLYRVCYYLAVNQAATTSSATQVTVGWTDGTATAQTFVGTNLNANTVGQKDGNCVSLESNGSNITLAISYASVGGTVMQYRYRATAGLTQ